MQRSPLNPWNWSLNFGYNQAEIVTGATQTLTIAGQTAMNAEGQPMHPGDMRAQIALTLENLQAVLKAAKMEITDITRLGIFTTDMDATMDNYDLIAATFAAQGALPPVTLLGVTRLALPPLMFEIDANACK